MTGYDYCGESNSKMAKVSNAGGFVVCFFILSGCNLDGEELTFSSVEQDRRNPQMNKINSKVPPAVFAVAVTIILSLLVLVRSGLQGLLTITCLNSFRRRKTTFDRIREMRQDKKETQAFLERVFAHDPQFVGLNLSDHDPTFTRYASRPILNSNSNLFTFYAIRIIYAQDLRYGDSNGPLEMYLIVKPTSNPRVCMTVICWTSEDFYRWLDYNHANVWPRPKSRDKLSPH
jgi:hypothetical protein